MITNTHTIILSTERIGIVDNFNPKKLVSLLINKNLCRLEYFGGELDNQADYVDESEQRRIDNTTFITLHFDTDSLDSIEYIQNEEHVLNKTLAILNDKNIREFNTDGKDIEIFIY